MLSEERKKNHQKSPFDLRRVCEFWRRPSLQSPIRGPWLEVSLSGEKPVFITYTLLQMALKRINKVSFQWKWCSNVFADRTVKNVFVAVKRP